MGKTSLLKMYNIILKLRGPVRFNPSIYRYSEKQFTQSHMATIGLDYVSTTYKSPKGEDIAVKIWDTAGQERFKTITYSFYKQANGVIVTFDITNSTSFANVKTWLESIYQHADPSITKVLVGNKTDLEEDRKVSTEEARQLAETHKMQYFETSAKLNKNIDELMQHLMEQVHKKMFAVDAEERGKSVVIKSDKHQKGSKDANKKNSKCC